MLGRLFDSPLGVMLLILLVVLLFGSKRLPDAARGIGRSLRIFKSEVKHLSDDDDTRTAGQRGGADRPTEPVDPSPLEGRIVDGDPARRPGEQRRDA